MLGYDWPRFHAALNDLPAALLAAAVLFEVAWLLTRRTPFRAASFWTLMLGVAGTIGAVLAGRAAADAVDHDDVAHAVMERHETLGYVTLGVFAALAVWRVIRRGSDGRLESLSWSAFGVAGTAILIITSQLGGSLVFDHALGIRSDTLASVLERRGAMPPMPMMSDSAPPDSSRAARDSAKAQHDRTPHSHSKRPEQ